MKLNYFINEAFSKAIEDYQNNKNGENEIVFNSFLCIFIRLLMVINNELDIINPYMAESSEGLKSNLTKFGYSEDGLNRLFANLQLYYELEKENQNSQVKKKNGYFVTIQKQLIDMLISKKMNFHLTEKEANEFYSLLYTTDDKDPLKISYNYLMAEDIPEVEMYFKNQMAQNIKTEEKETKNLVNYRAYEIIGYSVEDINKMEAKQIDKINHQVYDYFKIRENAINKEYLLEKAISDFDKENNKMTSGNGYVDILLVMGVIFTVAMLTIIITYTVF